jgi:hypothetical protein
MVDRDMDKGKGILPSKGNGARSRDDPNIHRGDPNLQDPSRRHHAIHRGDPIAVCLETFSFSFNKGF